MNLNSIWKKKWKILEGIWNKLFPTPTIEEIATYREELCRSCPYYDKYGTSENAVLKGEPTCSICGCNISYLCRSMSSRCSKEEIDEIPMWTDEKRYK